MGNIYIYIYENKIYYSYKTDVEELQLSRDVVQLMCRNLFVFLNTVID